MENLANSLDLEKSVFYKLEITQDLQKVINILIHARAEKKVLSILEKVEKSYYWSNLENDLKSFEWKYLRISHKDLWTVKKIVSKTKLKPSSKNIIEDDENFQANDVYESEGYLVWKYVWVKFYKNAMWSLVLETKWGWVEIIWMDIINSWITIEEIDKREFNKKSKLKEAPKVFQWEVDKILNYKKN